MSENKAEKVNAILLDCLFRDKEAPNGVAPEGAVLVKGIRTNFGFHRERLESRRAEVAAILDEMPEQFHKSGGGGWSFLNLCMDRSGHHWAEHHTMDVLCCLAIGLGLGRWQLPREMWGALPGGMPYVVFDTNVTTEVKVS